MLRRKWDMPCRMWDTGGGAGWGGGQPKRPET